MSEATPPKNIPEGIPSTVTDSAIDDLIQRGDFSALTMRERSIFCYNLAKRLGLDPLTKPFDFIVLNNKYTLYANRTCSDQLRQIHKITSTVLYEGPLMLGAEVKNDVYCVRVKVTNPEGRTEEAIGCIGITNKKDEELGNAIMKCHTKALRRGTLAFCGLGLPDELEVESIAPKGLEGGVGSPRRVEVAQLSPGSPQESFIEANPLPRVEATPVQAKPVLVKPLPQAGAPSSQPATPKLPAVLPAVKPVKP
jgi:hypothetical protein